MNLDSVIITGEINGMKQKTERASVPYSYLIDNIKVLLIFLVVFNHIIAFRLVKVDMVVKYIWYAITIFHMPAFIFISGYLSKKPQNVMKNVKNLLIPYILGYTLTWYSQIWLGKSVDYELLRPSGTVMWYVLALFVYRLTIEALGKMRFIVPLSIIFALWAGTRAEFTTYLSSSRIVVFFPFFVAGYLWKSDYIRAVRKFKGKWMLIPVCGVLLWVVPHYMISNSMPVDIFRGNHSYVLCGLSDPEGVIVRAMMYLISFFVIYTLLALIPDRKLPLTYIGRHTMGIYFFHYPIMILMNGLYILQIPQLLNVWSLLGISLIFILVLGSLPMDLLYTGALNLLTWLLFKKEKTVKDEGLEEEYDSDEDRLQRLSHRKKAIDELAATLGSEPVPEHIRTMDPDEFKNESVGHKELKQPAAPDIPDHMQDAFANEDLGLEIEEENFEETSEDFFQEAEEEMTLEELMEELERTTRKIQAGSGAGNMYEE